VAAFPAREDPRDALVWPGETSLDALPPPRTGPSVIRAETTGAVGDGDALGRRLAQTLLLQGGTALHRSQSPVDRDQERRQLIDDHSNGQVVWSNSDRILDAAVRREPRRNSC